MRVLALSLALLIGAPAQDAGATALRGTPNAELEANPLRGLHAVALAIDGLDDDALSHYGLSRSALLSGMTEKLQRAGLELVRAEDLPGRPDAALLSLHLRLMRAPYYFYLYNVKLALRSRLPLAQDPGAYTTLETWSEGSVGEVQPTSLGTLSEFSLSLVDRFIAAHAAQNPG